MPSDPPITRDFLADTLDRLAMLLELKGENAFKIRAYKNGADVVREFSGDIVERARAGDLSGIKGIGSALQEKLQALATTGKMPLYEKVRAEFPDGIFDLLGLSGLGPKKVKVLYEALEVGDLPSLKKACESGKVGDLPGFGKKSVEKILESIEFQASHAERFRLGDVVAVARELRDFLRLHPEANQVEIAGSYRRGKETLHDLDFLVSSGDPESVIEHFTKAEPVEKVELRGDTKASVRLGNGLQADLRVVENAAFPFALSYFTGSKAHNVEMRGRMRDRGLSLNEYGLTPIEGKEGVDVPKIEEERGLYEFLGLDYVEPELRENTGEFEAAADGTLPRLIELENLRGTFHNHTTASDGRNSLEEMGAAAIELGLEYLGIADHSKSSFQANGLDEERLVAQVAEIEKINQNYEADGEKFRLLSGSEVDILKDGSLDFDDSILAQLDYVVASVHNAMTLDEAAMTKRLVKAIENEHVTMLGHLTGRLLLKREAYAVNVGKIIDACAANGTVIELNANPWRLDMDWRWWKTARDKGVLCAINPDAHRVQQLEYLWFGVKQARKGWLRREDVLNTKSLEEIRGWLDR